jgi:hypothetical protein
MGPGTVERLLETVGLSDTPGVVAEGKDGQ